MIEGAAIPRLARGVKLREDKARDRWVVLVYLLSVIHDRPVYCRPVYWACDKRHWPESLDRALISQSRMSRRLRTVGVLQFLERLLAAAGETAGTSLVKRIDSKPLTVGAYSKDKEAKKGRLADGLFGKGYRLHVIADGGSFKQFLIAPLNVHDSVVGEELLPKLEGGGYVLGDNAYDTNDCHGAAASAHHQLVSPPRECNKGVRDLKYNCPERLRSLDIVDSPLEKCGPPPAFGQELYNSRQLIESAFGGLTHCGLGPLPAWVQTPRRVALWSAGKMIIYMVKKAMKNNVLHA